MKGTTFSDTISDGNGKVNLNHMNQHKFMKKLLLSLAFGAFAAASALAVPARPGLRTVTQPDGSTLKVRILGDERFHSMVTADGLAVGRNAEGFLAYRTAEGLSDIRAHELGHRSETEAKFIADNYENLAFTRVAAARKTRSAKAAASAPAKAGATQVPTKDSPRVVVLLCQYKDKKFRDGANALQTFKNFFSEGATSAHQYFSDQSNGKFTPQFDVYGPFTLTGNRSTYGGNDPYYGNDKGVGKMVAETCKGLDSQVNFKNYDNDGDGVCDVVIVLYAGDGEASSYDNDAENAVWPCQWDLRNSDYGSNLTLDGVTVSKFAVFNELYGSDLSKIDGIGTFCHEFSHCLGLPDFYDTNYGPHFGMDAFSLMDQGSYGNEGFTPVGYSAYEKEFMGWIEIPEAVENTRYALPVFNQKNAATDQAVKITNDRDKNEYYIIENRKQQGWDEYLPTSGGMISHVTYSASAWANNTVNDYDLQRMTLMPADGNLKLDSQYYYGQTIYFANEESLLGDFWPYESANELTNTSTPQAATVNTGTYMNKPVTEIAIEDNGDLSFWFMRAPRPRYATPTDLTVSNRTASSFTVAWAHESAQPVTFNMEVAPYSVVTEVISSTFPSNDWTATKAQGTAGSYYIGSSNYTGSLVSPSFTSDNSGLVTIRVNAKSYGSDASSLSIKTLNAAGTEIDSKTIALTTSFADYEVVLKANKNAVCKVQLATIAKKKRVYVNSATIYNGGDAEAAAPKKAPSETGDSNNRTITGITDLQHTVADLTPNGVYSVRVRAISQDEDNFDHSEWSETLKVDLSDANSVIEVIAPATTDAPAEYFNLQGVRVNAADAPAGIYLMKKGSEVSKVVIR